MKRHSATDIQERKRSRYIETFLLVLLLIVVLLVASHYDYEYQKEDRQAQTDCRIQDNQ